MASNELKIGFCGLVYSKCPRYITKECFGCQPNEVCPLPACAKERNLGDCKDFPCKKSYRERPIVSELLDH